MPFGDRVFAQRLGHLGHLKGDERMAGVAVSVVLDEERPCLVVPVFADELSRGLRKEQDGAGNNAWTDHLEPKGEAAVDVDVREVLMSAVDG